MYWTDVPRHAGQGRVPAAESLWKGIPMKIATLCAGLALTALVAPPAVAETTLGKNDQARVDRARPRDRDEVRYCLIQKKKGARKGTIIGAAGGAATGVIAGGNLGETLLAGGAGAVAGNLLGKGTSTNKQCDEVLRRNK
jgi:outer membrane lipoprotein SlyB